MVNTPLPCGIFNGAGWEARQIQNHRPRLIWVIYQIYSLPRRWKGEWIMELPSRFQKLNWFWGQRKKLMLRVRTHDQNFVPLMICNKFVTLLKINVPFRQINVPPCQINVPPCQINVPHCQINVPHCQINVPLSNKCPKILRQNHDPRDIYFP